MEYESRSTIFNYVKNILLGGIFAGGIYVAYKAGEKAERSRHIGYIEGRQDSKAEETATIHNVSRMIDRELLVAKHLKDGAAVEVSKVEKDIQGVQRLNRMQIRSIIESKTNNTQKLSLLLGFLKPLKDLFASGTMTKEECLDSIGEINAQLEELEKAIPMGGDNGVMRDMIKEEISVFRKHLQNY